MHTAVYSFALLLSRLPGFLYSDDNRLLVARNDLLLLLHPLLPRLLFLYNDNRLNIRG